MAARSTPTQLLKALADDTRLRLVRALLEQEFCVCELADALEVQQSNLSQHLGVLRRAGLVRERKRGIWVYYSVAEEARPRVVRVLGALGGMAEDRWRSDRARLHKRLAMRCNGECHLGYNQLPPTGGGKTGRQS